MKPEVNGSVERVRRSKLMLAILASIVEHTAAVFDAREGGVCNALEAGESDEAGEEVTECEAAGEGEASEGLDVFATQLRLSGLEVDGLRRASASLVYRETGIMG